MLLPSFKLSIATVLLLSPLAAACAGGINEPDDDDSTSAGDGNDAGAAGAGSAEANGGSAGTGDPDELPDFDAGGDPVHSTSGHDGSGGNVGSQGSGSESTGADSANTGGSQGTGPSAGGGGEGGAGGPNHGYDCGAFSEAATWDVREGFRAVVVADASDGLTQPVAATFAEGSF